MKTILELAATVLALLGVALAGVIWIARNSFYSTLGMSVFSLQVNMAEAIALLAIILTANFSIGGLLVLVPAHVARLTVKGSAGKASEPTPRAYGKAIGSFLVSFVLTFLFGLFLSAEMSAFPPTGPGPSSLQILVLLIGSTAVASVITASFLRVALEKEETSGAPIRSTRAWKLLGVVLLALVPVAYTYSAFEIQNRIASEAKDLISPLPVSRPSLFAFGIRVSCVQVKAASSIAGDPPISRSLYFFGHSGGHVLLAEPPNNRNESMPILSVPASSVSLETTEACWAAD